MSDKLYFLLGVVIACGGLVLLVHADVPVIRGGGVGAGLAALELLAALGVVMASVVSARHVQ
jgi:hypothetical protein